MNERTICSGSKAVLIGLTTLLLAACAGTGGGDRAQSGSPQGVSVEERAQARWELMVERDFNAAWEYYTPGFREVTERADFRAEMSRRPIRWLAASVRDADCEAEQCRVRVDVTYQAIAAPAGQSRNRITRLVDETWVRLDDQWWFVQN